MDGFEALQNRISTFLRINNNYVKTLPRTILPVRANFPGYYQGGYHAFQRYYNSLSQGVTHPYTINPFIQIIDLPPGKNLIELVDYHLIPISLQEEYIELTNRYNELLQLLQINYIEPNNGETQQYYAKVRTRRGTTPDFTPKGEFRASLLYMNVNDEIKRLLHLRELMREEYFRLRKRLYEIEHSERELPKDKYIIINLVDSALYQWVMSYFNNQPNNYGRSASYIKAEQIIKIKDVDLDTVHSFEGNEITKVNIELCKGPDALMHNLLIKGFRNTLLDLYSSLANEIKPTGEMTEEWKEKVRKHFEITDIMPGDFYGELYTLFKYIKEPEKLTGEDNNYTAASRLLTNIFLRGGIYGYDSNKNIESSLAMFIKYRHTYFSKHEWVAKLNDIIDEYNSRGLKVIFRCVATNKTDREYDDPILVLMEDDPKTIEIGEPVVGNKTYLLLDHSKPVNEYGKNRKKRYFRYFGDYRYQLDTSMYDEKGWIDNRNSRNLCSITCLVMNKRFRTEIERRGFIVDELIAECILRLNIHSDIRLFKVDFTKMQQIHIFIRERTGYNFNVKYYTYSDNGNIYKPLLITGFKGDKKDKYDVIKVSGHAFLVSDKEHLEYLLENVNPMKARISENPKYNVLDQIRYETLIADRLRNKTLLHDIIGITNFGRDICIGQMYYPVGTLFSLLTESKRTIIRCRDLELTNTKLTSELKKIPIDYLRNEALEMLNDLSSLLHIQNVLSSLLNTIQTLKSKLKSLCNLQYGVMDMETRNDDKNKAVCYGLSYNIFDDTNILSKGNIHNLDNNQSEDEIIYHYLLRMVNYMRSTKRARLRIFAHNGGKFDTQILRLACTRINRKLGDFNFSIDSEIKSGGRIKMFNVSFGIKQIMKDGEEEMRYYRIELVDSVLLLESPIADMAKNYGLTNCKKGAYPYLFYRYLIVDEQKKKMIWTRKELLEKVKSFHGADKEDLEKFLEETKNQESYDFIKIFEEYCDQDVNIAALGLIKANEMYSQAGMDILSDKGRGIIIDEKLRLSRARLLDCVTLSSLAKKIMKYKVLSKSGYTYKGIDYEYLKCYTGGLTFCSKVQTVVSSLMKDIVNNPYFYIDDIPRNKGILEFFVNRYGYDRNKPLLTYDREYPPAKVIILKMNMELTNKACILLLDANSLYPSAIDLMKKYGGFPIGEFTKFIGNVPPEAKRWIGYARIKWSKEALECEPDDFPMHPLIINTKNGNRHLTPNDKEAEYFGLSDIMYKSAIETRSELYTIELINGVYWKETSTSFSDICRQMYEERKKYKNGVINDKGEIEVEKNDVLSDCIKKVMNSFYGVLLEKCHSETVAYLNRHAKFKFTPDVDLETNTDVFHIRKYPSEKDCHIKNYGDLSDYVDINNYSRASTIDIDKIDSYASSVQYGVFVLDMSKYIMNILFNALNWDILYTDTDSAFFTNEQFNKIKHLVIDGKNLIGGELGQFKPDFDDKFTKGRGEKTCAPLNKDYGIVSILSIFNGKKNYCNVLFGQVGTADKTYLSVCLQSACKGVKHKHFSIQDYYSININEAIKQNQTDICTKFVVAKDGVYVYNKGDRDYIRTVTNMDRINAKSFK